MTPPPPTHAPIIALIMKLEMPMLLVPSSDSRGEMAVRFVRAAHPQK